MGLLVFTKLAERWVSNLWRERRSRSSKNRMGGGGQLPLLVENRDGYQNLCRLITRMKLRSSKGQGEVTWEDLEEFSDGLICLTGGEPGALQSVLELRGLSQAQRFLDRLRFVFGARDVFVEV